MLAIGNPYGYRLNVNHPIIDSLYRKHKREVLKIQEAFPMSDKERLEFEDKAIVHLVHKGALKYE